MINTTQEQTVLANQHHNATYTNQESYYGSYKPRLIEFSGAEGEDFRNFMEILDSFFAVSNITDETRKVIVLKAQLRRTAKSFLESELHSGGSTSTNTLTYTQAIEKLKSRYITPELINRYLISFNELVQGADEHPRTFLGRLQEAAELAELKDKDNQIEIRFQIGLLPEIRKFCIRNSAHTFKEYLDKADGWWNAERPCTINMKDSPFNPRDADLRYVRNNASNYERKNNVTFNEDLHVIEKNDYRPYGYERLKEVREPSIANLNSAIKSP